MMLADAEFRKMLAEQRTPLGRGAVRLGWLLGVGLYVVAFGVAPVAVPLVLIWWLW